MLSLLHVKSLLWCLSFLKFSWIYEVTAALGSILFVCFLVSSPSLKHFKSRLHKVNQVHRLAKRSFLAADAIPADDTEPELLQRADPEGDVDPFGLEEPIRQALPVLLQPPVQEHRANTAAPSACCPPVRCFIHIKFIQTFVIDDAHLVFILHPPGLSFLLLLPGHLRSRATILHLLLLQLFLLHLCLLHLCSLLKGRGASTRPAS